MNSVNVWGFIAAFVISAGIWFLLTSAIDAVDDIITNKKKETKNGKSVKDNKQDTDCTSA